MEIIKHLFGFCGESWHPNILNLSMLCSPLIIYWNKIIIFVKTKLKTKLKTFKHLL